MRFLPAFCFSSSLRLRVTSIANADGRFYYVNGGGLYHATNPGFAAPD